MKLIIKKIGLQGYFTLLLASLSSGQNRREKQT